MNKVFCDRCGQECVEGSTFYTIDIFGHDTNPTNDGRIAFDAYQQNFNTNLVKILKQEKHYCKKCKDEIEEFMGIKNKPVEKNPYGGDMMLFQNRRDYSKSDET